MGRMAVGFATVLVALAMVSCGQDLTREERFQTALDARAADAIERGIVPSWIPDDSTDIRVATELDRNFVWIRFQVPAESLTALGGQLSPLDQDEYEGEVAWDIPGPSWWPQCLTEFDAEVCKRRYAVYAGPPFLLAVDRDAQAAFAWTSPAIARYFEAPE